MMPKEHIICSIALGSTLGLVGIDIIPALIIMIVSIIIDIDHAFNYIVRFKKYNLIGMIFYFRKDANLIKTRDPLPVFIFHNYETIFILSILSGFFPFMIYILAGVIFHIILDWGVMPYKTYPTIIKMSLILVLLENYRRNRGDGRW